MRWFARPDITAQQLGLAPRLPAWNKADDPDQIRPQAYLDDAEGLLAEWRVDGPWALRIDLGLPAAHGLLEGADLNNYAYPLARRVQDTNLVSVWFTKHLNTQSFVQIEAAREVPPPSTDVLIATANAPASSVTFQEQIYAAVAGAAELPTGPVKLELAFVVGPNRNWLELWQQTVGSLDPILGRTEPERAWHPRDSRITELGLHVTVDPSARDEIVVGVAGAQAPIEAQNTRYVLRTAARAHGWRVLIDDEYASDTYRLPDVSIRVDWAASGRVLMAFGGENMIARSDDVSSKAERVLSALANRTGEFPPASTNDAASIETPER